MKKSVWYVLCVFIVWTLVSCGSYGMSESDEFTVKIMNEASEDIYGIEYTYYINGEIISSGGVCNADYSAIKNGEEFILYDIPETKEFYLEFSVVDENGNIYPCLSKISIKNSEQYTIQLFGNFENGFDIKILPKLNVGYFGFDI